MRQQQSLCNAGQSGLGHGADTAGQQTENKGPDQRLAFRSALSALLVRLHWSGAPWRDSNGERRAVARQQKTSRCSAVNFKWTSQSKLPRSASYAWDTSRGHLGHRSSVCNRKPTRQCCTARRKRAALKKNVFWPRYLRATSRPRCMPKTAAREASRGARVQRLVQGTVLWRTTNPVCVRSQTTLTRSTVLWWGMAIPHSQCETQNGGASSLEKSGSVRRKSQTTIRHTPYCERWCEAKSSRQGERSQPA